MRYCISDTSLCEIDGNVPAAALVEYATLLLRTGINRLEIPFFLWQCLRDSVPVERVALVIAGPEERETARRDGVSDFVTRSDTFLQAFPAAYSDVTVVIPLGSPDDMRSCKPFAGRCAGLRATGLADVMTGDYHAAYARLTGMVSSLDADDSLSLATAADLEWLFAGGRTVAAAFGGVGGHAPLEQLLAALCVTRRQPYCLTHLPRLSTLFAALTGKAVVPHMPVTGADIFTYESGIHADGIQKNPRTYEPFPPEAVGLSRRLSIGKHSGKAALRLKLEQLGVQADEVSLDALNALIRERSTRMRRGFTDEELLALEQSLHGKP